MVSGLHLFTFDLEEKSNEPIMISRRNFIKQSGALMSAASIGLSGFTVPDKKKYKMGLQLYTVRDAMASDTREALKKIASFGYQDLETYGYQSDQGKYYGMKAPDFKKLLEDNQLTTTSGHYDLFLFLDKPVDELRRYVDQCIEGAQALGQHYITWPWLDPSSRTLDKFKLLSGRLNLVGEQVNKAKLEFAYHNHDFEFIDQGGENGYNIIMRDTDPTLVKLQIDLYWAMFASKLSPHELFTKQPGRFVMWHVKDMHKVSRDYTELGNGSIDYTTILPDASLAGMHYYFIEQGSNFAKDPMQSIADSASFFKQHLERHLEH
jgi:sugar phosphate isomerase/epimerase